MDWSLGERRVTCRGVSGCVSITVAAEAIVDDSVEESLPRDERGVCGVFKWGLPRHYALHDFLALSERVTHRLLLDVVLKHVTCLKR